MEKELDPAFLTVALAELDLRPKSSLSEIKNIVEWSDRDSDPRYNGHDYSAIASLYPLIRIFDITGRSPEETWNVFFQSCIDECEAGTSWIDGDLASTLRALCELDSKRVPYKVLCRSVFDGDKSSFFLAQYRCLEALYAYSSARNLQKALDIKESWSKIATALEDVLGWHPREEGSLDGILKFASQADLEMVLHTLARPIPKNPELLISGTAKAIYSLRNSFVHYRPAQHRMEVESIKWNILCMAMVGIVLDVYDEVFSGAVK